MTRKVAMVVAGGSGIGADVARTLRENEFDVAVMSSSGKGEAIAEKLGGFGFTGSNLNPAELRSFVEGTLDRFARIDAVVNNTGHGPKGPILAITDDEWHLAMDCYLLNVIRMARLVLPTMAEAGGGSIVNISTFAAFEPDADFPTSGVFRAGLASFTKSFSTQYAAKGVRMNNVLPGFVDSLPEKADRVARIPAERYARVREISDVVAFLASDASSYVTGQNIRVDGGLTASV